MWVIKLGGSLDQSPHLSKLVRHIEEQGTGKVVLVPGGGGFADQIREMQRLWGFDQRCAHYIALLAMQQFGWILVSLGDLLQPASGSHAIAAVLDNGCVPVWFPERDELDSAGIAASWDVTSDSLAVWLAAKLAAKACILVKSCRLPKENISSRDAVRLGMVDRSVPDFLAQTGCPVTLCNPVDLIATASLSIGQPRGARLLR